MRFTPWGRAETIPDQCTSFNAALSRVVAPLSPRHYDTKQVVDQLMSGRLEAILDLVFGRMFNPDDGSVTPDAWMIEADANPEGPEATALMELLGPTSPLVDILLQLSAVPADFRQKVRKQFKDDVPRKDDGAVDGADGGSFGNPVLDVPLAFVCGNHWALQSEESDLDLFTLPVDRAPAVLLLPVWHPPITTRSPRGSTSRRSQTSVPCTPLAYFLFRMQLYAHVAAFTAGRTIEFAPEEEPRWAQRFDGAVKDGVAALLRMRAAPVVHDDPCAPRLRFYARLYQAFLEHFASSIRVQYPKSEREVAACLLVHGPAALWQRYALPETEAHRIAVRDLKLMSLLCHVAPIIEAIVNSSRSWPPSMAQLTSLGASEIGNPERAAFRFGVTVLRQLLLSLPLAYRVPKAHTASILRLVLALTEAPVARARHPTANESSGGGDRIAAAVVMHYEAFSVVLADLMRCCVECHNCFFGHDDPQLVALMARVFRTIAADDVLPCLQHISRAVASRGERPDDAAGRAVADQLRTQSVLVWSDDAGNSYTGRHDNFMPMWTGDVATAVGHFAERVHSATQRAIYEPLTEALDAAFPGIVARTKAAMLKSPAHRAARTPEPSASLLNTSTATPRRTPGRFEPKVQLLDDESRLNLTRGHIAHVDPTDSRDLVFRKHSEDKMPPLGADDIVIVARACFMAERGVRAAQRWIAAQQGYLPTCLTGGHPMHLDQSPSARQLWHCRQCGGCANHPQPLTLMGYKIVPAATCDEAADSEADAVVCDRCHFVMPPETDRNAVRRFFVPLTEAFLCPECAGQPFRSWRFMWVARVQTLLAAAAVIALLLLWRWGAIGPREPPGYIDDLL